MLLVCLSALPARAFAAESEVEIPETGDRAKVQRYVLLLSACLCCFLLRRRAYNG